MRSIFINAQDTTNSAMPASVVLAILSAAVAILLQVATHSQAALSTMAAKPSVSILVAVPALFLTIS